MANLRHLVVFWARHLAIENADLGAGANNLPACRYAPGSREIRNRREAVSADSSSYWL